MQSLIRFIFLMLAWPIVLLTAPVVIVATVYEWSEKRNLFNGVKK